MKFRSILVLLLALPVLFAFASGCSTLGKMDLGRVVTSGRDGWQLPDRVIADLDLQPGDIVAEIGAGAGYWLPFLSEAVGSEGRVYAVEVSDDLVAKLSERVTRDELENVVVVRGQFEDPLLPDGEIDMALTSNTYHHIDDRAAYFQRLRDDLSVSGRVVHVDHRDDVPLPIRWLQTSGHWTQPALIQTEMGEAGYEKVEEFDFLPLQSFQIFVPISEGS